jgi:hypothetical protein
VSDIVACLMKAPRNAKGRGGIAGFGPEDSSETGERADSERGAAFVSFGERSVKRLRINDRSCLNRPVHSCLY